MRALAGETRDLGQGKGDPSGTVAGLVQQLADRGEQLADQISARGPGGLVQDLRSFAARKPGTFLLGALAAGHRDRATGQGRHGRQHPERDELRHGRRGLRRDAVPRRPPASASDLSLSAVPPVAPVTPVATTQETTYLGDVPVAHQRRQRDPGRAGHDGSRAGLR